ncbi:MAG: hypothetical protein COU33_01985 [Candidatus Magasanikbacteria bacterium CG10_big_fil_rev_8_21_14_0_10_43_6]|uniref:DegT/DnrJ/EryC1/StrS aminotransferase family protein n=1 Tax=Candidatus Magasanikbacteria bacterium CG10_big_fil_rev_8_21_14_0_10_43_6 TaxID=1974650 RepID=A0A2M6W1F5_9BACT|nr:MAG: hypothetical protein COU33_01985 [Candidatus Magasanikbacteria bacterium CG10_big_fil_rev_8_21_14_0_10_43_6]
MHVAKVFLLALYYKKPVYSFFKAIRFSSATATDFSLASCTLDTEYQKGFLASQAILGLGQLKDASTILTKRRIIADWYDTELRGVSGIRIPDIHPDTELSHYWVVLKKDRQDVRKKLYAQGINTGIANEYSCPTTPHYAPQHDAALFTGTTDIGDSIINLPYYIGLTKKDVVRICTIFKQVYGESR